MKEKMNYYVNQAATENNYSSGKMQEMHQSRESDYIDTESETNQSVMAGDELV
jgi:hypothetical protein